jgi:hypothetical protein
MPTAVVGVVEWLDGRVVEEEEEVVEERAACVYVHACMRLCLPVCMSVSVYICV